VRSNARPAGYGPDEIVEIESYAVGQGTLANAPGINHTTLKAKGFTPEIGSPLLTTAQKGSTTKISSAQRKSCE
jgi:hypothetical protein